MSVKLPSWLYKTTWIYHITHIDNLGSIITDGGLFSHNHQFSRVSIANEDVQGRRSSIVVPNTSYTLHDYVPFYFAPRSPMLRANYVQNMPNARPQEEIIYLVTNAEAIAQAGLEFVFTDRHSILMTASFYKNLSDLQHIKWPLFFESPRIGEYAEIWQSRPNKPEWVDRKEIRQAEFLIYRQLPCELIKGVGVINDGVACKVTDVLSQFRTNYKVIVRREWYY